MTIFYYLIYIQFIFLLEIYVPRKFKGSKDHFLPKKQIGK
jgi:hypothetical protein